jgi:type I restriction enzyme S subunit
MSWQKVKLGDLCIIEKGKTGIQKAISGEFPLVVTAEERKSHNEYQFDDEAVIIPLVSGTGHGHASIKRLHFQSGKFALGSILCAVIPKDKSILNAEYLFRFLNLNKERELVDRMKGMANVTLPIKEIAKIEIPLPTLEEQIEFVEKYSLLETDSEDIYSELAHQLFLIKQLRQSFLREAMQGKLVKSTNIEETGQLLLAKIKATKAKLTAEKKLKKEKELPQITEEEIPFEIPEHWAWCKLGETGQLKRGKSKHRPRNDESLFVKGNTPFIQTGDVARSKTNGYIINTINGYYNDFGLAQSEIQKKGTLCITIAANIAECGFLGFDACTPDSIVNYISINKIIEKYVFYYLIDAKDEIEKYAPATAQKNINLGILNDLKLPLPPLHEQEQIVVNLEELMAFCDGLEQSIKESQGYNEMLLQQVLREALQGEKEVANE